MEKDEQTQLIQSNGVIAIVRLDRSEELVQVARAIREGGIRVIEFTMTTPNALTILADAAREFGEDVLLGAGTVLDPETARAAILAGAQFIVAPTLNPDVVEACHRYSKTAIPGAYTPTEILTAWECCAEFVKVFPADIGGPAFIRALRAPLPHVRLIPVGGITLSNVADFIQAGAAAVGVGNSLVKGSWIASKRFNELTHLAQQFMESVSRARIQVH